MTENETDRDRGGPASRLMWVAVFSMLAVVGYLNNLEIMFITATGTILFFIIEAITNA